MMRLEGVKERDKSSGKSVMLLKKKDFLMMKSVERVSLVNAIS
jgi:hypothetical protein